MNAVTITFVAECRLNDVSTSLYAKISGSSSTGAIADKMLMAKMYHRMADERE